MWRESAPQRYDTLGGLFSVFAKGPLDQRCVWPRSADEMARYDFRNRDIRRAIRDLGRDVVLPLNIYNMTVSNPYPGKVKWGDCTHYALPGVPDSWSLLLFHGLLSP
jgi:hypothetical protein